MGDRTVYRATARRDGHGWVVSVHDLNEGCLPTFHARDLADVEPRALKVIWGYTGRDDVDLDIEVELPPVTQDRLEIIRQHCADIEAEYDAAIVELVEMGLPLLDVSRVLDLHHRMPRPLTVSNAELAEHGLALQPGAVGVEWDEHTSPLRGCVAGTWTRSARRTGTSTPTGSTPSSTG